MSNNNWRKCDPVIKKSSDYDITRYNIVKCQCTWFMICSYIFSQDNTYLIIYI